MSSGRPERHPRVVGPDGTTATIRTNTVVLAGPDGTDDLLEGIATASARSPSRPTGRCLATASRDHDARIWDVATGEPFGRLQHNSAVHDAQFSPDGRWLVTAGSRAASGMRGRH